MNQQLSPRATARYEADLAKLRGVVVRRRRGRVTLRTGVGVAVVLALAWAVWPRGTPVALPQEIVIASIPESLPVVSHTTITMIETDPSLLTRVSVAPRSVPVMDDAELCEALTAAGIPTGITRIAGRVLLPDDLTMYLNPSTP